MQFGSLNLGRLATLSSDFILFYQKNLQWLGLKKKLTATHTAPVLTV
jgi:hypothetical protein